MKLPNTRQRVVIFWKNKLGLERTSIGFYAAKHTINEDEWEEGVDADYCEDDDQYYCPEGWYEDLWEGECFYPLSGVVGWQKLPEFEEDKQ